jgi:hypothetical protein
MSDKLATPCCNAGYEKDEVSACCEAQISDSGLCYDCHEHTESEGYICDECEDWLDERDLVEKVYNCGFCGEELNKDSGYCSKECHVADNTEGV